MSTVVVINKTAAGAVDPEFCAYIRLMGEPSGGPWGTLVTPWGDPEGPKGTHGGSWTPWGLLWCAFSMMLKMCSELDVLNGAVMKKPKKHRTGANRELSSTAYSDKIWVSGTH